MASFILGLKERNIYGTGRNLAFEINTSSDNTRYSLQVVEPHVFNKKTWIHWPLKESWKLGEKNKKKYI